MTASHPTLRSHANAAQERALWAWRETITETERREGRSAKHDVSVPISAIPRFIAEAEEAVHVAHPGARVLAFGHVGDGNIHFNVLLGDQRPQRVNRTVHAIVREFAGSITAEHGIGRYRLTNYPSTAHRRDGAHARGQKRARSARTDESRSRPLSLQA